MSFMHYIKDHGWGVFEAQVFPKGAAKNADEICDPPVAPGIVGSETQRVLEGPVRKLSD